MPWPRSGLQLREGRPKLCSRRLPPQRGHKSRTETLRGREALGHLQKETSRTGADSQDAGRWGALPGQLLEEAALV